MKYLTHKNALSLILMTFIIGCTVSVENDSKDPDLSNMTESEKVATYDEELAVRLGADDYGMKKFVMAILKPGPNRDQDSTAAAQIQRAHLDNLTQWAEDGLLVAAGPFFDDPMDYQGVFVFNVATIDEALALTKDDPAVKAGRLLFEFHPWYSSASLMLINEWHQKIAKKNP